MSQNCGEGLCIKVCRWNALINVLSTINRLMSNCALSRQAQQHTYHKHIGMTGTVTRGQRWRKQRWGKPVSFILFFNYFSQLSNHCLPIEYHFLIRQVSPQHTSSVTYVKKRKGFIKTFLNGDINERALVTPTPGMFAMNI